MPGPLPDPNARRRNAPTIAVTELDPDGPKQDTPPVPDYVDLDDAGLAWWEWAWHTPQASAWDEGSLYTVCRRAQLEDDMVALATVDDAFDIADLLEIEHTHMTQRISSIFKRMKALASNKVAVAKEARELDNRLGLNPKAMADLRWRIKAPEKKPEGSSPSVANLTDRRSRLSNAS